MKILLRRDQRAAMLGGKPVFSLTVRAELTPEEVQNINKYKLGETELYASHQLTDRGSGLLGAASRAAFKALITSITVNDLYTGKKVECKDVVELLGIEEQVRAAATTFKSVLEAAAHFGGEEVLEL